MSRYEDPVIISCSISGVIALLLRRRQRAQPASAGHLKDDLGSLLDLVDRDVHTGRRSFEEKRRPGIKA